MSRYRREIDNVRAHTKSLWVVIGLCFVAIGGLLGMLWRMPAEITVHIPPDLRQGAVMRLGEIPTPNIFTFATYVFQQLNTWPKDGQDDYGQNIYRLAAYLTPAFRTWLIQDMHRRAHRGELAGRMRSVEIVPGHGFTQHRVTHPAARIWIVTLDLRLTETVRGMTVKDTTIRYPLRVVRRPTDWERNPWGLALAGFARPPKRLTADIAGGDHAVQ
jgi:integrating conjugative element protein (TIGR03746 family)